MFYFYKKQQHIILCAQKYLQKNPQYQDYGFQFDVITFSGEQTEPEWIQNAFEGTWNITIEDFISKPII